ncbi:GH1 family beta-glucosidase [Pedobacter glucosidilyticus]|uniref:GH1 family beta-glucosidase n=1 Tax=Pedobacter glucosidilyticus TaxID=1122941 RepID=UPI0026E94545|nr:GH1 family beta-glucosidase [Pedobacter glucosidilyticus]
MPINPEEFPSVQEFGPDFKWGVSVAAYQIEGGHDADGKGPSIWDVFTNKKGKVLNGDHGNIACDFYHRYTEDISLIKKLHIPNFRFSISWSRILPKGTGEVNQAGIDYYHQLIDECLANDITPWITLYHWDLPQELEKQGGWTNRKVITWFEEFTKLCIITFGDKVQHWIVMNEPVVFTGAGYFLGLHAPGRRGMKNFLPAIHHATMAIVASAKIIRQIKPDADIGTTFSCSYLEPYRNLERDRKAVARVDALLNRLYIEPLLGLGYPVQELPVLKGLQKYILAGDLEQLSFDFDFIGIQNYTREIIKNSWLTPYIGASLVKAEKRKVPITSMKWEVYPEAIYQMIKQFNAYPQIKKLLITENGAAFPDVKKDGHIHDTERLKYLQDNIKQVLRAKKEGYKVEGYFVWTLTDNFEWAEGYHPRFGLIHIDFDTQERTIKDSGWWLSKFLKGLG